MTGIDFYKECVARIFGCRADQVNANVQVYERSARLHLGDLFAGFPNFGGVFHPETFWVADPEKERARYITPGLSLSGNRLYLPVDYSFQFWGNGKYRIVLFRNGSPIGRLGEHRALYNGKRDLMASGSDCVLFDEMKLEFVVFGGVKDKDVGLVATTDTGFNCQLKYIEFSRS